MAIGEVGMFLPAESAYGTPGAFSQALRAEATKRASYLSQMDQFYAGLEESKRQFEETMTFREESWEEEMGLRKGELDLRRRMGLADLFVKMYRAKTERTAAKRVGRTGEGLYLGRDKKLELLKDIWKEQKGGTGESGWLGPGFSYPSTGSPGMYD
jgi:hypothetical protein